MWASRHDSAGANGAPRRETSGSLPPCHILHLRLPTRLHAAGTTARRPTDDVISQDDINLVTNLLEDEQAETHRSPIPRDSLITDEKKGRSLGSRPVPMSAQISVRLLAAVPGQLSAVPVATAVSAAVATVATAVAAVASARALPDQRARLDPSEVPIDAACAYLVGGVVDVVVRHEVRVRVIRREELSLLALRIVEVAYGVVDAVPLAEVSDPDT